MALLFCSGLAFAGEPTGLLTIGADDAQIALGSHLSVLRDPEGARSFAEVSRPPLSGKFSPARQAVPNFGVTSDAIWYRTDLRLGPEAVVRDWILDIQYPVLDFVDVHVVREHGPVESIHMGDRAQSPPQQLFARTFAVPLHLNPGEKVTLYVRALTGGLHQMQMVLWSPPPFVAKTTRDNLWNGLAFGILLVMAMYNLVIFAVTRDRAYLYYVCYVANIILMLLNLNGFARLFGNGLGEQAPGFINASSLVFMGCVALFGQRFVASFLQTARYVPRFDLGLKALSVFTVLVILTSQWLPYTQAVRLLNGINAASSIAAIVVGIYLVRRGHRAARLYLAGWIVLLGATATIALQAFGIIEAVFNPYYALQAGSCIEATLLSLALADRINAERRERERLERLKEFFSPQVAQAILQDGESNLLAPKRLDITVVFTDLRGFTALAAEAEPEDVMRVLHEYHESVIDAVTQHGGTVEHFAGDGVMIYFNAPLPIDAPEARAARMALQLRGEFEKLCELWRKRGYQLGVGIGMASGYATVGAMGSKGRMGYSCIGTVTNLAARLCAEARHGQILVSKQLLARVQEIVSAEDLGERPLKGLPKPVQVFALRAAH